MIFIDQLPLNWCMVFSIEQKFILWILWFRYLDDFGHKEIILRREIKIWVLTSINSSLVLYMDTSQQQWKYYDHLKWTPIMELQWIFQRLNTHTYYLPPCQPPCSLKFPLWLKLTLFSYILYYSLKGYYVVLMVFYWSQHILDVLREEGSIVARDILCVITSAINLWLGARCLMCLAYFVASATWHCHYRLVVEYTPLLHILFWGV